ncbi:MAG: hypothetical protein QOE06_145 [Thermoleophilaceae bacterium]|jgi:DNA-binding NarL/FixJ family response regulator|nr:hypothetical protein [Thermoleophilaceae bacterium]
MSGSVGSLEPRGGGGPLTLLIVDANATMRKGTELLLRSWGHHVIGSAGEADGGFDLVSKRRPDVTLVDQGLPGGGAALVRRIMGADPAAAVILHLGRPRHPEIDEAMRCGARGLVPKTGEPGELLRAIGIVGAGGTYVSPLCAKAVQSDSRLLTEREREVLQLLAHGVSGADASTLLTISPETVRTHIRNASRRLGAQTRAQAVVMAIANEEIEL